MLQLHKSTCILDTVSKALLTQWGKTVNRWSQGPTGWCEERSCLSTPQQGGQSCKGGLARRAMRTSLRHAWLTAQMW